MNGSLTSSSGKVNHTYNNNNDENDPNNVVTINEKVNLTKNQHEVLQMICNSYQMSVSEHMEEALVEAMRFDIEEGNSSLVLLEKLDEGEDKNKKKTHSSAPPSSMKSELDKLQAS
jgi:hypothetical protein